MAKFTYEQVKNKVCVFYQVCDSITGICVKDMLMVLKDEEEFHKRSFYLTNAVQNEFGDKYYLQSQILSDRAKRFVFD